MRLSCRIVLVLALTPLCGLTASAQRTVHPSELSDLDQPEHVLLYATFVETHVTSVPNNSGAAMTGTTGVSSPGLGLGVTFNVHRFPALADVTLGLDFRLAYVPITSSEANDPGFSNAGRTNQGFVGVKATFHPASTRLQPYVEVAAGSVTANAYVAATSLIPATSRRTSWSGSEFIAGLDYALLRHISVRLVEFGAGEGHPTNGEVLDKLGVPDSTFYTVTTGAAFHF